MYYMHHVLYCVFTVCASVCMVVGSCNTVLVCMYIRIRMYCVVCACVFACVFACVYAQVVLSC